MDILKKEPNLLQEIEKRSQKEDAIQRMARTVVYAMWQSIVDNKFDPKSPRVKVSYELVDQIVAIFWEKELTKKLMDLCDDVLEILLKKKVDNIDLVDQLYGEVYAIRQAADELAKTLNRLVLYPIILNTKCNLCPA